MKRLLLLRNNTWRQPGVFCSLVLFICAIFKLGLRYATAVPESKKQIA
jgi:hypothetical protein